MLPLLACDAIDVDCEDYRECLTRNASEAFARAIN